MKKLLFASTLVFAFCFYSLAQTTEILHCPKVFLIGPKTLEPDKSEINTAQIIGEASDSNIKYKWIVIGGEIIEGQGTSVVKVLRDNLGRILTVTVEVSGLPRDCLNTASETSFSDPSPKAEKINEFSFDEKQIDKAKLDNLIHQLQKDPSSQAFIIEKFKRNTSKIVINKKTKKITEYLVKFRNQDLTRFTILTDLAGENSTQLWIVPAGAIPPKVNNQ